MNRTNRSRRDLLRAAFSIVALPFGARAEQEYPSRPIRIIVPFSAGTAVDILPRLVADKLSAHWHQPIIVENRPGAAGNIGAEIVARSVPDGYTMLASPAPPLVINQALYPSLPFDPRAFVPVTVIAEVPNVLVVSPRLGAKTLDDLLRMGRRRTAGLSYASPGNGTTPHLTAEWFGALAGIHLIHVPYKGGAPAIADLLGGHVDMMFANLGDVLPHVHSGKLVLIAVGSARRLPALPDLPAISERFTGFVSVAWYGIVAPSGTPAAVAEAWSSAVCEALAQPDVKAKLAELEAQPIGSTPPQTAAFMHAEAQRWHNIIVAAGVSAQ
jgi:tripartite-type tricarboxylate transporter receptor subunit TctC